VPVGGELCADGGFTDRIGARAWREWRAECSAIVHLVDRSGGSAEDPGVDDLIVVNTPRSFAKLWNLGDIERRFEEARQRTHEVLDAAAVSEARNG
jgi:hypothetical protein